MPKMVPASKEELARRVSASKPSPKPKAKPKAAKKDTGK